MPRANRFSLPGLIHHLTHRCHDRSFLLRFGCDRSEYRERLRWASKEFGVPLLNYCVTSNHTHLVAVESRVGGICEMMQKLEGDFAGYYNRRKERTGSFWDDRYHGIMIEDGEHLWNCMAYVDMNMVRAGAVAHPEQWPWCGYQELVGQKTRYRLLDLDRVLQLMGYPDWVGFRQDYRARIRLAVEKRRLEREGHWTESIAVGSEQFVKEIAGTLRYRRRKLNMEVGPDGSWVVREGTPRYGISKIGLKNREVPR